MGKKLIRFSLLGILLGLLIVGGCDCDKKNPLGPGTGEVQSVDVVTDPDGIGTATLGDKGYTLKAVDNETRQPLSNIQCTITAGEATTGIVVLADPSGNYISRLSGLESGSITKETQEVGVQFIVSGAREIYLVARDRIKGGSHLVYDERIEDLRDGLRITKRALEGNYSFYRTATLGDLKATASDIAWGIADKYVDMAVGAVIPAGGLALSITSHLWTGLDIEQKILEQAYAATYENLGYSDGQKFEIWKGKHGKFWEC